MAVKVDIAGVESVEEQARIAREGAMKWLLIASISLGALSAFLAWMGFLLSFAGEPSSAANGFAWAHLFWGSLVTCTICSFVSAFAGWRVISRPTAR